MPNQKVGKGARGVLGEGSAPERLLGLHRHLEHMVEEGDFREDLMFRLAVVELEVPPLRERREDIPALARAFAARLAAQWDVDVRLSDALVDVLAARPWPGNVRELRHVVQRAYVLATGDAIGASPEPPPKAAALDDGAIVFRVGMSFEEVEREMLLKTLAHHGNNKRQAARVLGITPKTIYNRLLRYRSLGLIDDEVLGNAEDADD